MESTATIAPGKVPSPEEIIKAVQGMVAARTVTAYRRGLELTSILTPEYMLWQRANYLAQH